MQSLLLVLLGVLILILLIITLVAIVLIVIYLMAKLNIIFFTLAPNEAKFGMEGDDPVHVYVNYEDSVRGKLVYRPENNRLVGLKELEKELVGNTKLTDDDRKKQMQAALDYLEYGKVKIGDWHVLGLYCSGIAYPFQKIHSYKFRWPVIIPDKNKKADDVIIDAKSAIRTRDEEVFSIHLFKVYPIYLPDIKLKGGVLCDLIFTLTVMVEDPKTPVFIHRGDWLSGVFAPIEGACNDYCKELSLEEFINATKEVAEGLNIGKATEIAAAMLAAGRDIEGRFGVKILAVDFMNFKPKGPVVEALQKEQAAVAEGKANIATAKAKETAAKHEAAATTAILEARADQYNKSPGLVRVEIAGNLKATTLVTGGANPSIFLGDDKPTT